MKRIVPWAAWFAAMIVSSDEPAVVSPDKAATMAGRTCVVEGPVLGTQRAADGCRLSFTAPPSAGLTAVIFAINLHRWPADIEAMYRGKIVRVTGVVQTFRGTPELIVSDPSQIIVVGKAPAALVAAAKASAVAPAPVPATGANVATRTPEVVSGPPPDMTQLPFTVSVRRYGGTRQVTADSYSGASFKRRACIELTLRNMSNRPVGDIGWQWVGVVAHLGGGPDQYHHGQQSGVELQPFETRTIRSEDISLTSFETRYTTTGNRLRAHYVKVFYKGYCVFKEASPAEYATDIEDYLDRLAKGKPLPKQPPTPTFSPVTDTILKARKPRTVRAPAPPPPPVQQAR
jgi:hypothetical protein